MLDFTCTTLRQSTLWHIQGLLPHVHLLEMPVFTSASVVGVAASRLKRVKSLWHDMHSFTHHWHAEHASTLNTDWTTLALYGESGLCRTWQVGMGDTWCRSRRDTFTPFCCGFTCHSKGDATEKGWPQPEDLRPPLVCSAAHCATLPSCTSISSTS